MVTSGSGMVRIGVVGAGVSGLVCARTIAEAFPESVALTVFEWGRGAGGRTARRRVDKQLSDGSQLGFDHAAPYFHCGEDVDSIASRLLSGWEAKGWVLPWDGEFLEVSMGDASKSSANVPWASRSEDKRLRRWVAYPASNSLCKAMAAELVDVHYAQIQYGQHVTEAKRNLSGQGAKWTVSVQDRGTKETLAHELDYLILTDKLLVQENKYGVLPSDYIGELARANGVQSTCVAVLMVAFPQGSLNTSAPFSTISVEGHPVLTQIIRDSAKPGREAQADVLVVHSTESYAASRLKDDWFEDEDVAKGELLRELTEFLHEAELFQHPPPEPLFAQAHMWDCAQPRSADLLGKPLGCHLSLSKDGGEQGGAAPALSAILSSFLLDAPERLGACGDFCSAEGGVMGAAVSGFELGRAVVGEVTAIAAAGTDFSGMWVRDNDASEGLVEYLRAHGHPDKRAEQSASRVYVQTWERGYGESKELGGLGGGRDEALVWTVETEATNHLTGDREISRRITYTLGTWEERFTGGSTLFGDRPGTVRRNTSWQLQPGASTGVAHVTTSETPIGREETRRWLKVYCVFCCGPAVNPTQMQ